MIKTVKIQGDGYLVNGTISVPKAEGNRHYEDVKIWLADNTPEPEFTQAELDAQVDAQAKRDRDKALDELVITHNTVAYDANGKAIGNMSAVMGVANFKFNQMLANDFLPSDAYQAIYKETKIWWKGFDDQPHEVMIESICEALELSMLGVSDILGL